VSRIDLDDTSRCPRGVRCESCGTESDHLAVETATSGRLGVLCLTLCRTCAAYDELIPVSVSTAERLVAQHCGHLGITVEGMAAELELRRRSQ